MPSMPWFRFYNEVMTDIKFPIIARELQEDKLTIIGAWSVVLSLAAQSPIRGKLLLTTTKAFEIIDIAQALGWHEQDTEMLIEQFISMGMIDIIDNVFCVKNWDNRQFTSDLKDPTAAERMRRKRERERNNVTDEDSNRYGSVTQTLRPDTDTESDTEDNISLPKTEWNFRNMLESITGLMVNQSDLKVVTGWEKEGVTEDDIRAALAWRKENVGKPIKTISQLEGGVKTERSKRIQDENGRKPKRSKSTFQQTVDEVARQRGIILPKEGEILDV